MFVEQTSRIWLIQSSLNHKTISAHFIPLSFLDVKIFKIKFNVVNLKVSEEERNFEEEEESKESESFNTYINKHAQKTEAKIQAQKK